MILPLLASLTLLATSPLVHLPSPFSLLPSPPVVLKAARLLDVRSGKITADALVVVQDGKIIQVGGVAPAGAEVVNLGDVTLMPGLIDAHVHLTNQISPGFEMSPVRETIADEALHGAFNAGKTVRAGFTTVRNLGAGGFSDVALMHAIERGEVEGPRIIPAGNAIGITGGHCDVTGFAPGILTLGPIDGVANGADQMMEAVRLQAKYGAKVIKICATAGVLSYDATVGAQQMSDAELRAVVEEAARHGLKVAAHAHGTAGIKAAVRAGVASIDHGSMLDDEAIALMKERGTYLVPTRALSGLLDRNTLPPPIRAKMDEVMPLADVSFKKAVAAGREDRIRHRCRGDAARDERQGILRDGSGGDDADRRNSRRDAEWCRLARHARSRRDRGGEARRPDCGAGESAERRDGAGEGELRDGGGTEGEVRAR